MTDNASVSSETSGCLTAEPDEILTIENTTQDEQPATSKNWKEWFKDIHFYKVSDKILFVKCSLPLILSPSSCVLT